MQPEKRPLLKGLVSFQEGNIKETLRGEFELYEDHVILRISDRFSFPSLARPLPPTFPGVEMKEYILFSHITSIDRGMKKGALSRNVTWKMKTDEGITWNISGSSKLFEFVQNAYQAWKLSNLR